MSRHEEQLRVMLNDLPTPPAWPGFGARVAERGRRRRMVRASGATSAAVVCAVTVIALFGVGADPDGAPVLDDRTSDAPMTISPTPPKATLDCSTPPNAAVEGDPVVPPGAVAARLCGGLVDNAGFDSMWPDDTLQGEHVEQLVDRLNRLEPYVEREVCTLPGGAVFDLVLSYADGSKLLVHGDTAGSCAHLTVQGGKDWTGAESILRETLGLIAQQRATLEPGSHIEPAQCPQSWNDVYSTAEADPLTPQSAVVVTACRYVLTPDPGTITQSWPGRLKKEVGVDDPTSLTAAIAAGIRADPCRGVAYDLHATQDVFLIRDRRGDIQVVSTAPCWAYQVTGTRLYPSPALADAAAELLE